MIDVEKLNSAKAWIEKLANGINPLNDELVKDDDLINNVHISRCLFYVSELLGEINIETSVERRSRKPFFLSKNDAVNIPISIPNGIANFVRLVNGYIPEGMKPLSAGQTIKWLRNEGLMKEVQKEDGHKTNLPTEKGNSIGITTEVQRNPEGIDYQRVVYSVDAQRFMLNNIEAIATLQ
ncbi:MAG: hypothetical protein SOX22_01170 [Bacteroidaceae bacterium]|nr:hypothetical protein [Paraprevotella sp.]MDY3287586.1 hypothetical protein [Bacteroidaceae bacterium]MDY4785825.1 hypothetical protein [Bacteroidaceae bacterium]